MQQQPERTVELRQRQLEADKLIIAHHRREGNTALAEQLRQLYVTARAQLARDVKEIRRQQVSIAFEIGKRHRAADILASHGVPLTHRTFNAFRRGQAAR
jgi:hypothetical protein